MTRTKFRVEAIRRLEALDGQKGRHKFTPYDLHTTIGLQQMLAADGVSTSRTSNDWNFEE